MASKAVKQQKTWVEQWKDHVLGFYDRAGLIGQAGSLMKHDRRMTFPVTPIEAAGYEMVDGGCFLVYYGQIDDFAKENPGLIDRRKSDQNRWDQYRTNVVRAIKNVFYDQEHALTDEELMKALKQALYTKEIAQDPETRHVWVKLNECSEIVLRTGRRWRNVEYRFLAPNLWDIISLNGSAVTKGSDGNEWLELPVNGGFIDEYERLVQEDMIRDEKLKEAIQ